MNLILVDYAIIIGYFVIAVVIVFLLIKRASGGTTDFFVSGRSLPWWLLGTSMVATTFSTDTPNLIANLVREKGVSYNWIWWAFLLSGMLTVFFFAKMWRRSGVLTDLEFYEIRYSGKSAAIVRGFRSIYLGFFFNCVIMGTVTLSAAKIANILFGWSKIETVIIGSIAAILFSLPAGLWGVVVTDFLLFIMAMSGAIAAAVFALKHEAVGGLCGMVEQLSPETLNLIPDFNHSQLVLSILIIPLFIQWWSVWYPGAEPGGGSYIAQRMLAAKNEKHALGATLWFNVAHYAIRPWPWIIVALCSIIVFPQLKDIQTAFPHVDPDLIGHDMAYPAMLIFLPAGIRGLMVASLGAAYLSTMDTSLNWGASYLVHDFYKRFLNPSASEKYLVAVSRVTTILLMMIAACLMFFLENARESFTLLLSIGAGTGLIYVLRWFWWRINAWSEISAMASSFVVSLLFFFLKKNGLIISDSMMLLLSVITTTVIWITVTFLTKPEPENTLVSFYEKIKPAGQGWEPIRMKAKSVQCPENLRDNLLGFILSVMMVYSALFFTGSLVYAQWIKAFIFSIPLLTGIIGLVKLLPKLNLRIS